MRVVHCKREPYTHYIGRPSVLGNPYSHRPSKHATVVVTSAEQAVARFEKYARATPELLVVVAKLPEDAVLGCWCKVKGDEPCHGDVIIKLWKEMHVVL